MDYRLNIEVQHKSHYTLVNLAGRLDTLSSEYFSVALQQELDNNDYLVLDFFQCIYLSSSGIRTLVSASKKLAAKGGLLLLTHLPVEVFQVLEMSGLLDIIPCYSDNLLAEQRIVREEGKGRKQYDIIIEEIRYLVDEQQIKPSEALFWDKRDLAGYSELGIAAGIGAPGEKLIHNPDDNGLFIKLGNCSASIPFNPLDPPDFRVVTEASKGSIFIEFACSFPACYSVMIQPALISNIPECMLLLHAQKIMKSVDKYRICSFLIANTNPSKPTLTILIEVDIKQKQPFPEPWPSQLSPCLLKAGEKTYAGIQFVLNHISEYREDESLDQFINHNLTLQNIDSVRIPELNSSVYSPIVWIFTASELISAESSRTKIEIPEDLPWESYKNYLVRSLYTDSAKVVLHPLHGGYSAQTFHSVSYDKKGRQLRPTVLKIAGRELIIREAERCRKYSLPYIMNNSAMILGTSTYMNRGALRYNFVGIGGEQSRLQWLTHYYKTWPAEKLEPLFNKIFLNILKPWYGQAVREKIFLYRDHNPTRTFFPHLCETAEELFRISVDEKLMKPEGEKRGLLNPYWFLKYQYPAREGQSIDYYQSVCHGDLNMQNILLYEQMNVYLIDFSETRPRSVVSDFARLEVIFMVECAPLRDEQSYQQMVQLVTEFYNTSQLSRLPDVQWKGKGAGVMMKNITLTKRMRSYALMAAAGDENIFPYYLAMLEWILPIVCYQGVDYLYKKLSAYLAGLLLDKILECENVS